MGIFSSPRTAEIDFPQQQSNSTFSAFQGQSFSSDALLAFNPVPYTPGPNLPTTAPSPFPLPKLISENKSDSYLYATVRFAIWDRQVDKVVSYGEFTVNQSRSVPNSTGVWLIFEDIAKTLIHESHLGE
jgi:hypothetical protein